MTEARTYLKRMFERAGVISGSGVSDSLQSRSSSHAKIRLVVASHDLKFMGELMRFLNNDPRFEVRQDNWRTLRDHDVEQSTSLAAWADVVFCEWAGPALSWYSKHCLLYTSPSPRDS